MEGLETSLAPPYTKEKLMNIRAIIEVQREKEWFNGIIDYIQNRIFKDAYNGLKQSLISLTVLKLNTKGNSKPFQNYLPDILNTLYELFPDSSFTLKYSNEYLLVDFFCYQAQKK
jgi:hypothetical protein